ncbi:apolipoprotein N-acyltransferase [Croceibacterium sp. LX-88]|uniref:Apolipoprotein N-acyltransferase n=1 Tax=Croceibacterium selenioxidans TaxID=2838833 RepID=A0ABS5W775_9SPHN|nr:apolipoprotein N-acyltransferase [Croceibacterium selenioxidans]MBT2135602.1 apolipoprotein N-acyltransferase [Croceibacterium selenioxidans]
MALVLSSWRYLADRPRLSALGLGALAATGFQPLGLWPLALATMALFAALVAEAPDTRRAAALGWFFGLGHFTFGNNWIAAAFTHQAEMPAVLGWAAVPILSLYLAIYPALAAMGARAISRGGLNWTLAWAFAGCWTLSELMRASVFSGYAWNPFAMVLLGPFDRPGLAAIAPWMGTYALSGVAVFLSIALAVLVRERRNRVALLVAILLVVGMYLPAPAEREGKLNFTLVQPDLRQYRISDPLYYEANYLRLAEFTHPRQPGQLRLVLWPESGLADYIEPGYPQRYYDRMTAFGDPELARARIGRLIGPGSVLLTGAVELEIAGGRAVGAYNSVSALDEGGAILGSYDKAHLVPYGEYLPMRQVLEPIGLSRLVPGSIDFIPGPGPRTLDLGALGKAGVQVCYEIVFSGEVVERGNRPDYIFNPSNDGWFGSFGPPQHLAQARLRAIEEGLPVLRSTTTGISAVIDPHGVVRHHLPMHKAGRIDGTIPLAASPTPFSQLGNALAVVWAMVFLGLAYIASRRGRR